MIGVMFRFTGAQHKTLSVLLALLFVSIFLVIYLHYSSRQLTEQNLALAHELELKREHWEALLLEKNALTQRSRLQGLARTLGMSLPAKSQIMMLHKPAQAELPHSSP